MPRPLIQPCRPWWVLARLCLITAWWLLLKGSTVTEPYLLLLLLLVWQAPLGVPSARCTRQSPEWTILCFIHGEVFGFQVFIQVVLWRPGGLLQFSKGEAVKISSWHLFRLAFMQCGWTGEKCRAWTMVRNVWLPSCPSPHHSAHGDTIWFLVVSANTVDREHQSGVHLSWWLSTTQNLTSVVETTCLCHQFVVSFLGPSIVCQTALSARMSAGVYNILPCVPHCQQYRRSVCVTTVRELQLGWNNESLLTFDLAFCWAKVRSKYWLKLKSKVVSLSQSLRPNLRFGDWLAERLRPKFRSKYLLRPKLSRTNLT